MAEPHDPNLLDRLKADLRLGDDTASNLILHKVHEMAARMDKASPPLAERILIRGILATQPRIYEERRRRRQGDRQERIADALTKAFAVVTAFNLALFALVLSLLFWGFWTPPPDPDSLEIGWSDGFVGVSTEPSDAADDENVEAEKGPDDEEQPEEKAVDEPEAEKVTENEAADDAEAPEQPGEEETTDSQSLVDAPSFSEAEYDDILSNMIPEIGPGASGVPSPIAPKELGRLIRDDPTDAVMKARKEEIGQLARGRKGDIIVVSGEWDIVQRVLTRFAVPHRTISPSQLGSADLSKALVVIVNCDTRYKHDGSRGTGAIYRQLRELQQEAERLRKEIDSLANGTSLHSKKQKELAEVETDIDTLTRAIDEQHGPSAAAINLRRFVGRGGYVMTSDWGVTLLEQAFPGYIAYADTLDKGSTVVSIPTEARDHALLRHSLLGESADTRVISKSIRWEIESTSYAFAVDESQVDVLARGTSLGGHKTIAATFRPALGTTGTTTGRVLHVLSHVKVQKDKYGDYALQNILLNFLLERVGSKD